MRGLHLVLLGVLLAASPKASALDGAPKAPARSRDAEALHGRSANLKIQRPCVKGSREAREAGVLLAAVDRAQQALEDGTSTANFAEALGALRRHRCFRLPAFGWPDTDEAEAPQVRAWWSAGGERWLRSFLEGGPEHRTVVLAPDLRKRLSGPNHFLLAKVRCDPGSPSCAPGDAWRVRADAALKAELAAGRPEPAPCVPLSGSDTDRYFHWIQCVHDRLGRSIELPPDSVNPPIEGWLVVRQRREAEDPAVACLDAASYSLATGDAWMLDTCDRSKTRIGRVSVVALRELALLLVVSDDLQYNVRAQSLEVDLPKELEPVWSEGIFGGVEGRWISHHVSVLPRTSWRVWTERAEKLESFAPSGASLSDRVAEQWLRQLDATLVVACPTAVPPPALFARLDEGRSDAWERALERQTYQRLEALMRERPKACDGRSGARQ